MIRPASQGTGTGEPAAPRELLGPPGEALAYGLPLAVLRGEIS